MLRHYRRPFLVLVLSSLLNAGPADGYFRQIVRFLQDSYIEQERLRDPGPMLRRALRALENAADEIMVDESKDPLGTTYTIIIDGRQKRRSLRIAGRETTSVDELAVTLERIMRFVETNYDGSVEVDELRYAMANGMTSALDPHTNVFTPKQYKEFFVHIEGEICGVGAYIGVRDGELIIISPLKDSPAQQAGILAGDVVLRIDDESTVSMSTQEAVSRIRGERDTEVVLWIRRKGVSSLIKKTLRRAQIEIKSVESKLLDDKIGYLKVVNFAQNTHASFQKNLQDLRKEAGGALRGVVLDLRDNPGGLLDQAAALADAFLKQGPIVLTAHKGIVFRPIEAKDDGTEPTGPVVVLVNQGSASGSEILAGALKNNDRAILLGQHTFGKGSVQQPRPLPDESCLKLTVYEYLLPKNVSIQNVGVTPDIALEPAIIEKEEIAVFAEDRAMREQLHRTAITSRFAREEKPFFSIVQYLDLPDDPVDADAVARSFVNGEFDLSSPEFTAVHLACHLILMTRPDDPFDRLSFLSRHRKEILDLKEEKFREVVEKLKAIGIDWRPGPEPKEPQIEVALSHTIEVEKAEIVTKKTESESAAESEEEDPTPKRKVVLQVTVRNRGQEAISRLYAVTETDDITSLFSEREFLFGYVPAGGEVTRTVQVKIPYFSIPREDAFNLALKMGDGETFRRQEFSVKVPLQTMPALAARATLTGPDGAAPSCLEPGKEYRLRVEVTNVSDTEVFQAIARFKNETEPSQAIYLKKGRTVFTNLKPKDSRTCDFTFEVKSKPEKDNYRFRMDVFETTSAQGVTKELDYPAAATTPLGIIDLRPPRISVSAATLLTDKEYVRIEAEAEDDVDLRYLMILTVARDKTHIDGYPDKIFFHRTSGKGPIKFATDVPLEEGTNLVNVVATNSQELKTIKSFLIRRR